MVLSMSTMSKNVLVPLVPAEELLRPQNIIVLELKYSTLLNPYMNTTTSFLTKDTARTGNIFQKVVIPHLFTHQTVCLTPTELENAEIDAEMLKFRTRTTPRLIGTSDSTVGAVAVLANAKKEFNLKDTLAIE